MSDEYPVLLGIVQKFPTQDLINVREAGDKTVHEFTVKAGGSQALVRITLWPEFAHAADAVEDGSFVAANGKFSAYSPEGSDKTYLNLSPTVLHIDGKRYYKDEDETPTKKKVAKAEKDLEAAPF